MRDYRRVIVGGKKKAVHRMRAERALGKPLPKGAVVHHADGSRDENAPLVICENHRYHMLLHERMRVVAAGGNPNTHAKCSMCKTLQPFSEFPVVSTSRGRLGNCRECMANYAREQWRKRHPGSQQRASYRTKRRMAA